MIYLHDDKEEKKLSVFVFDDEIGFTRDNSYVKEQIQSFVDRGYAVHHYLYPDLKKLPPKIQELYDSIYTNEALLERISDVGSHTYVQQILVEAVRQEISKFEVDDILEYVAEYILAKKNKM